MRILVSCFCFILFSSGAFAQYTFKTSKEISCTPIKNQQRTGTCWSFATSSFIESELIKMDKGQIDLSEMFVVQNIYKDKAHNYVYRQGKANFSQGSLSHDVIRMISREGLVPESVFSGKTLTDTKHDHSEMEAGLKGFLDGILKQKSLSPKWRTAVDQILAIYLGAAPKTFQYEGKNYTPMSFAQDLGIDAKNYVSLSSFTHHPFYSDFILEIPDNYSNGSFYNVPIDELVKTIDNALIEGYSVAWDGDVSEKGFSAKEGIAVLAEDEKREDLFTVPGKEMTVSQRTRQEGFESYATTDDHLMHIVGIALDQNGTKYYMIKNSWGEISDYKGYLYMSENYVRMKTMAIMVNKKGIPNATAKKLFATN